MVSKKKNFLDYSLYASIFNLFNLHCLNLHQLPKNDVVIVLKLAVVIK